MFVCVCVMIMYKDNGTWTLLCVIYNKESMPWYERTEQKEKSVMHTLHTARIIWKWMSFFLCWNHLFVWYQWHECDIAFPFEFLCGDNLLDIPNHKYFSRGGVKILGCIAFSGLKTTSYVHRQWELRRLQ